MSNFDKVQCSHIIFKLYLEPKKKFSFLISFECSPLTSEMICTRLLNTPVPRISSSISDKHKFPMPLQKRFLKTLKHFSCPIVTKTQVGLVDAVLEFAVKRGAESYSLCSNKLLSIDKFSILIEKYETKLFIRFSFDFLGIVLNTTYTFI